MRGLVARVLVLSLVVPMPSAAHTPGAYWPMAKVMRMIDGASARVAGRTVRVEAETALCSGEGRSRRRGGVRAWRHFRCTYTTKGGLGRDIEFRVHPLAARRFAVTEARWAGG